MAEKTQELIIRVICHEFYRTFSLTNFKFSFGPPFPRPSPSKPNKKNIKKQSQTENFFAITVFVKYVCTLWHSVHLDFHNSYYISKHCLFTRFCTKYFRFDHFECLITSTLSGLTLGTFLESSSASTCICSSVQTSSRYKIPHSEKQHSIPEQTYPDRDILPLLPNAWKINYVDIQHI